MSDAEKLPENTPEQIAAHEAQEAKWAEESGWPVWKVELVGEPREWKARNDERYWKQENPNDPNSPWVPRPADELPNDASLHPDSGMVVRTARATVYCHARSEDHAKMLALRDNEDYDSVESVEQVKDDATS